MDSSSSSLRILRIGTDVVRLTTGARLTSIPIAVHASASAIAGDWEISWVHFDERGDTRAMSDDSGNVIWSGRYYEYGGLVESAGGEPIYAHHGKSRIMNNTLTGLHHM